MNTIHPTAIIHPQAILGEENYIGPYCIIGPKASIGSGNRFEAYVSISTPPEHRDHFSSEGCGVVIGNENVFREYVTVNSGTFMPTKIGSYNTLLRGSHVGHDVLIEHNVTLSCNVLIGGESTIMMGANLGLGAILHQRQVIGSYAMIGMGSVVTKTAVVSPGKIFAGNPAKFLKLNKVGLQRAMISDEALAYENQRFINLRRP